MLHNPAQHFVQVVENALCIAYDKDDQTQWERIHLFYEKRYLNPNSPEKPNLWAHGYTHSINRNYRP
jgi:hypothetical protein